MEGMLRRIVGEDVRMTSVLAPDAGTALADVHQVEQVLLNLAANARDAMPHGGALEIRVGSRSIDAAFAASRAGLRPGDYIVLTVADTGSGMDEDTLSHLFEPFFTTKELGRGTGLGLSTVYGIVKQSDGYVDVRSEPGKGTEFSIYLPRLDAPPSAPGPLPPPPAARETGETVLVVDDSLSILKLVSAVLRARGYRVLEAEDGASAIGLLQGHEGAVSLVVTDVVMPEVGGLELAVQVRRLLPEARILFMTGYAPRPGLAEEVRESGALLLEKPFTPEQLLAKVGEALAPRA
jgi:CheY-like chemotaxis protein